MSSIDTAKAAYADAVAEHDRVLAHRNRCEAEIKTLEAELAAAEKAATTAHEDVRRAAAQRRLGFTPTNELEGADGRATSAAARRDELRHTLATTRDMLVEDNARLPHLTAACSAAREALANAVSAPLEEKLRADKKLRAMLMEVFALARLTRGPHGGGAVWSSWDGVLLDVFRAPTDDELAAAIERAEKHFNVKLPREVA
jgi:chromosome segregation ATPase